MKSCFLLFVCLIYPNSNQNSFIRSCFLVWLKAIVLRVSDVTLNSCWCSPVFFPCIFLVGTFLSGCYRYKSFSWSENVNTHFLSFIWYWKNSDAKLKLFCYCFPLFKTVNWALSQALGPFVVHVSANRFISSSCLNVIPARSLLSPNSKTVRLVNF